jgi:hypothetical protein
LCACAQAERIGDARKILEELQGLSPNSYVPAMAFGLIYFALGEIDKGFDWFEKGVDERDRMIFHIHVHPQFCDPLGAHPRYHALLRKMNLEP